MIQQEIAPISYVYMVDDNFTARSTEKLQSFCEQYKKDIGVPFFAQVSPLTINEKKMKILFDNGCAHITMGVETATKRIAEMYNRGKAHQAMKDAIAVVEKYRHLQMPPPTYQFIIDNPWEMPDEMLETLRLACSFPRPWNNPIYSLMLFPGVPLYYKALEEGIMRDKSDQIYGRNWRSQSRPYLQLWIRLYHANFHPFILRLMLLKWIARPFISKFADAMFKTRFLRWMWEEPS
jgi:anaerobic magnesium-protoporphyrin IX monomethyl ester cyclase